jgi:hypothetical protein
MMMKRVKKLNQTLARLVFDGTDVLSILSLSAVGEEPTGVF